MDQHHQSLGASLGFSETLNELLSQGRIMRMLHLGTHNDEPQHDGKLPEH